MRSFFQREEDLAVPSKAIPDTASDVLEKPSQSKIIDKPLPNSSLSTPPQTLNQPNGSSPRLPISPDELRIALQKNSATAHPIQASQSYQQVQTAVAHKPQEPMHIEIAEFEKAITAHESTLNPRKEPQRPSQNYLQRNMASQSTPLQNGFFDEYQQFMMQEELGEDSPSQDVVARMKSFHQHKKDGKEFYIMSKDLELAAKRKLDELQNLEQDWFETQEEMDSLSKSAALLEQEIEIRTSELRNLIRQAKSKSRLERQVAQGQEFTLNDGRKLSSLLDLKLSLHNMSDAVFSSHVNIQRNDFAAWTKNCLNDEDTAKQIAMTHSKEQLMLLLGKFS